MFLKGNRTSLKQLLLLPDMEIELHGHDIEDLEKRNSNMKVDSEELRTLFILSCSVFTAVFAWFLYWILYDVIVWNKSLFQVSVVNYFGLAAMVGLILFEVRIAAQLFRVPK